MINYDLIKVKEFIKTIDHNLLLLMVNNTLSDFSMTWTNNKWY